MCTFLEAIFSNDMISNVYESSLECECEFRGWASDHSPCFSWKLYFVPSWELYVMFHEIYASYSTNPNLPIGLIQENYESMVGKLANSFALNLDFKNQVNRIHKT